MKSFNKKLLLIALLSLLAVSIIVSILFVGQVSDSGEKVLPIPRFVSLGSEEINVRVGPGIRYPIRFVLKKKGLPVEIIKEFDVWRQIVTFDGDKGWIHKSLLSGRRKVIIKDYTRTVYKRPKPISKAVVKLKAGVVAKLHNCKSSWCKIEASGYEGWIDRASIWGVYPNEIFED